VVGHGVVNTDFPCNFIHFKISVPRKTIKLQITQVFSILLVAVLTGWLTVALAASDDPSPTTLTIHPLSRKQICPEPFTIWRRPDLLSLDEQQSSRLNIINADSGSSAFSREPWTMNADVSGCFWRIAGNKTDKCVQLRSPILKQNSCWKERLSLGTPLQWSYSSVQARA
jgi:hypothetical protein